MQDSPSRCVLDTNVPIDFHWGEMLEALFALPFDFLAPDVVVAELEVPDGQELLALGLRSLSLDGEQVSEVMTLAARHRRPSVNDLFALVLARTRGATLLTGDRALRDLAEAEGVDVHGTLWLLDELVRLKVATPWEASAGLNLMLDHGSRLPERESRLRIRRWRAQ